MGQEASAGNIPWKQRAYGGQCSEAPLNNKQYGPA